MGEVADMMLDGTLCEGCGVYIGADYGPSYCRDCASERPKNRVESFMDALPPPAVPKVGTFSTIMSDIATQVEHILAAQFKARSLDPKTAPMYAQMLVGMVALTGQWWLENSKVKKDEVAAHLVNLAWNGLTGLERNPTVSRH